MFYLCNSLIKLLNRSIYIKRISGVLLLLIFVLSNTPTKYLHFLFANHKDFVSKTLSNSNKPQINAAGINCHCDSNVIIAPYTMQDKLVIHPPAPVFSVYSIADVEKNVCSKQFSFGLRGPPFI